METAEAVSAPGEPCAEILAELVDHSLVVFGADAERRRYGMHETIRYFAQGYLTGSDQEADALERHARYYAQLVFQTWEVSLLILVTTLAPGHYSATACEYAAI